MAAKTIIRFLDDSSNPILDSLLVTLNGPLEGTPTDHPANPVVVGHNNGQRIFNDLSNGSYDVFFGDVKQVPISPMWIAGPVDTFSIPANSITGDDIADYAISARHITERAIDSPDMLGEAVVWAYQIKDGEVVTSKLANGAVTGDKIGQFVFGAGMENEDNTGWKPRCDGVTIHFNENHELEVLQMHVIIDGIAENNLSGSVITNGSLAATKIASKSIGEAQIADSSIVNALIAQGAITEDKLGSEAVNTANIKNQSITVEKLKGPEIPANSNEGGATIGSVPMNQEDGSFSLSKISDFNIEMGGISEISLSDSINAKLGFSSDLMVYVSPQFTYNAFPYFSSIQAAVDYLEAGTIAGVVMIYPGTYSLPVTIHSSISLIGLDKTKTIISCFPSIEFPGSINIQGIGSSNIMIDNLSIRSTALVDESYPIGRGIYMANALNAKVILNNCYIRAEGIVSSQSPSGTPGVGIHAENSLFVVKNSQIEAQGGKGLDSYGEDGIGIELHGEQTQGLIMNSNIYARGGKGVGGWGSNNGHSYGVYWNQQGVESITARSKITFKGCLIDSITNSFSDGTASFLNPAKPTPIVMHSGLRTGSASTVSPTMILSEVNNQISVMLGI